MSINLNNYEKRLAKLAKIEKVHLTYPDLKDLFKLKAQNTFTKANLGKKVFLLEGTCTYDNYDDDLENREDKVSVILTTHPFCNNRFGSGIVLNHTSKSVDELNKDDLLNLHSGVDTTLYMGSSEFIGNTLSNEFKNHLRYRVLYDEIYLLCINGKTYFDSKSFKAEWEKMIAECIEREEANERYRNRTAEEIEREKQERENINKEREIFFRFQWLAGFGHFLPIRQEDCVYTKHLSDEEFLKQYKILE